MVFKLLRTGLGAKTAQFRFIISVKSVPWDNIISRLDIHYNYPYVLYKLKARSY